MDAHDLLARLPDAVDADALEGMHATVQYEIERPLAHVVKDGRVTVVEGTIEAPDVVIAASDAVLLDLYRGRANPALAFMTGRLRVRGDVGIARRLVASVDRRRLPDEG